MSWTKQDAVLTAVYEALERWDAAERRARTIRGITKGNFRRQDRMPDGTRIPTPRRSALARHLTDAALTAIREYEAEAEDPHPDVDLFAGDPFETGELNLADGIDR
jgi:hypothetical protein